LRGGNKRLRDFLQWLFFPWIQCFPWAAPLLLDGVGLEIRGVARAGLPYLSPFPIRLEIKILRKVQLEELDSGECLELEKIAGYRSHQIR
jgi:hypothetical protein